ncbi:hypothetical protein NN3_19480 [Nocardia neocaledoniensis NBRC 108232]|uniref:Homeodomain-containing protein n=1 Tax=Nocardia neocaledoniensis TaxID=236511 RepID=A0A317NJF6_9NOCA|nr:helix-turn-helix domain-containing protein [Nocardia neocaledoniensis]PWV74997.1 homeodomain-containing protein [Nocardia neocaledoniensis]GEM30941.1 hypothetical protein NN3_19480 [Nocardia neocaledoniensis NBRC 108232]
MTHTPRDTLEPPGRPTVRARTSDQASAAGGGTDWLEILQAPERERLTVTEVCRRYRVSRKSYYSYLARYQEHGVVGLAPRSRRPKHLPSRTPASVEAAVVRLRLTHPRWGARRIRTHLERFGDHRVPALSTVHAILRRHGLVGAPSGSSTLTATQRSAGTERPTTTHQSSSRAGGETR